MPRPGYRSMNRSHEFTQDIIHCRTAGEAGRGQCGDDVETCRLVPQPALEASVAIVWLWVRLGLVPLLALVAHRGCDCRNPYLPVAIIQVCVLPCGVLRLLRFFCGHCPELRSFLGVPTGPNVVSQ